MIRIEKAEMSTSSRCSRVEGNLALGIAVRAEEKAVCW